MSTEMVASVDEPSGSQEEWFGEGSAFDSGEDLAAALFALAAASPAPRAQATESIWPALPAVDETFVEVQRNHSGRETTRVPAAPVPVRSPSAAPSPRTWSVRAPGESLLPRTVSGSSGWTIRNSVAVLHRTEEAIAKLREDAVEMTFLAAAEARGRGRPRNLERRRFPR